MARQLWLVMLLVLIVVSVGDLAWAQQQQRQFVVVYVEFQPAQVQDGKRLLQDLAETARRSPGSVRFTVLDEIERANRFGLFELWDSAQAFEDFTSSPTTQALLQQLEPLLAAPLDQRPGNRIR